MAKKPKKGGGKKAAAASKAPARSSAAAQPAASTAVLDELLKVTGQEAPKKGESLQAFSERVLTAMAEVKDDDFKSMSAEARGWYEKNFELFNSEKFSDLVAAPGMPGFVAAGPEEAPAPTETEQAAPAPAEKSSEPEAPKSTQETDVSKKTKGGKKAAQQQTNGSAERKPRTDSTAYQVRLAVVKNPDIEFEALCKKLDIKGKAADPTGHVHNMFAHAKHVMRIAGETYKLGSK